MIIWKTNLYLYTFRKPKTDRLLQEGSLYNQPEYEATLLLVPLSMLDGIVNRIIQIVSLREMAICSPVYESAPVVKSQLSPFPHIHYTAG